MPPRKKTTTEVPTLDSNEIKKSTKEVNRVAEIEKLHVQLTQQIKVLFDFLTKELNEVETIKKKTQEEIELAKKYGKQQEEEQNFNFLMTQRKKQAEFDEKLEKEKKAFEENKEQKEKELKLLKENLDNKDNEFKQLKLQIEEVKKQTATDLKKDFDNEKKLMIQKYESDIKLLQQQINSLQQQVKQQEKENEFLKDEKSKAMEQIKELAVAVIKGKEKDLPPSQDL